VEDTINRSTRCDLEGDRFDLEARFNL